MITVEDILRGLGSLVVSQRITDSWHRNFISNVQGHVSQKKPLSTNQANIILKLARNVETDLYKVMRSDLASIQSAINNPSYRLSPYQSISMPREVRYLGADKLAFRFKVDSTVVSDLKALRSSSDVIDNKATFNDQYRLWVVTVTSGNLEKIFQLIQRHKFSHDHSVLEYLTVCSNSRDSVSTFVLAPESVIAANVCNNQVLAYVVTNILKGDYI